MGQATQRGSFIQRRQMALDRNEKLKLDFAALKNGPMHRRLKLSGVQRVATMLTAVGILQPPKFTSREVENKPTLK